MNDSVGVDIRISDRGHRQGEGESSLPTRTAGGMLRVYVQGGGCSGFQYGFDLENDSEADDYVVERDGVRLVVDPLSYQYIIGSEIDYQEDLQGSQFVVRNPNASTTCGLRPVVFDLSPGRGRRLAARLRPSPGPRSRPAIRRRTGPTGRSRDRPRRAPPPRSRR